MAEIEPHLPGFETICVVCGSDQGVLNGRARNGLPAGVVLYAECYDAIEQRQVGIVRRLDNSLDITDGRVQETR